MLASHAWLEELVGIALDPAEVARRLTAAGIEVEAVHRYGDGLDHVVLADVRATRPHPKRAKLSLVTVFDGASEQEIVCGASNVPPPGGHVVFAKLGAKLPSGIAIAERELAGVVSRGMLCSERELDAGSDESGILVLEAGKPGTPVVAALGLRDSVYELSLTPNRADCLGHIGLARELCVLLGRDFSWPKAVGKVRAARASAETFPQKESVCELGLGTSLPTNADFTGVRVDVAAKDRCPRYGAALVSGVAVGRSPFWLRNRLHRLGLRAINNIVDVTNYILMLFGHPIHAFDYERLRRGRIEVRLARAGEQMRTLDDQVRELTADDLLICDGEGPVALAGVMGGANSEIAGSTQRVLIECAYFDPRSVRRSSKRTGLHTDSSHRFERGVDSDDVRAVLAYAAAMLAELAGGVALDDALDIDARPQTEPKIRLRSARIEALLGKSIEPERAEQLLRRLGCGVQSSAAGFEVVAPSHRPDIAREVDLIEELARLVGYDSLPSVLPRIVPSAEGTPHAINFVRALRSAAAAAGLTEAINYAFVAPSSLARARAPSLALRLVNPMSEDRSTMRTSLLPGLADNLRHAQRTQQKRFASFELAHVFHPRAAQLLPDERIALGILCWGQRKHWYPENELFDFYDVKAMLEAIVRPLAGAMPATVLDPELERDAPELHPRRAARVKLADRTIGVIGELHPDVVSALELEGRPIWSALDVAELSAALAASSSRALEPLPRFPSSVRDIAVVVAELALAGEIAEALHEAAGPMAESVVLFDIYRGDPVPPGHKSLAFHVVYRDRDATLTDRVVDEIHAKVVRAAEQRFSGSIRR